MNEKVPVAKTSFHALSADTVPDSSHRCEFSPLCVQLGWDVKVKRAHTSSKPLSEKHNPEPAHGWGWTDLAR